MLSLEEGELEVGWSEVIFGFYSQGQNCWRITTF